MHKWWRHSLLELRLLFGNPLFASLPIIYAILFIIMMRGGERQRAEP